MKTFKLALILASISLNALSFSSVVNAEDRLNGRQAADTCKQEITSLYYDSAEIKFGRNPASSIKSGAFTFWINSTEKADGDKNSVRYLCEITRVGELVSIKREDGRWRI